MHPGRALGGGWLLALALACARTPVAAPAPADEAAPARAGPGARVPPAPASRLPDVPLVTGPLDLRVVYPPAGALVSARDSSFLLGSTGAGDAELTVNGAPVKVWPNGGWIAWLGLPADTALRFELRARTPRDSAVIVHELRAPPRFAAPATGLWIDTLSMTPQGRLWLPSGERVAVAVRAAPGA
ncbi:MAG TPA: hypothetical protein VFU46_02725, partial [Gemmatimonadales bacterium]|nr:hypothetical protein [Gemmatimonadales bacterium]